jgi:hypothetical protein
MGVKHRLKGGIGGPFRLHGAADVAFPSQRGVRCRAIVLETL